MKRLMQGNEAVFQGALAAGATFFAGYPITPSSEILLMAAEEASENPRFKFLQSEDEIAAANALIGASLAGAKSFTATSGPGFSLMQEAIGYAHQVEVPCVFVNVQRVGPATGMPTMPAQQDILQTKYGTAGDYYPIVLYPNSVAECYQYTVAAFNAAEESMTPVILLSDGFVGHLIEMVDLDLIPIKTVARQRAPLGTGTRSFMGLTHDDAGVPRTADAEIYKSWLNRMKRRTAEVATGYPHFELSGNLESETLIIAFGIVSRVVEPLLSSMALFRPIRMFPVLEEQLISTTPRYREIIVIEANDGQYAGVVEQTIKRGVKRVSLEGGKISLEQILQGIKSQANLEVANVHG